MLLWQKYLATVALAAFAGCGGEIQAEGSSTEEEASAAAAEEQLATAGTDERLPFQASCSVAAESSPIAKEISETSGLARSRRDPTLFWTHNDGNDGELFGIGSDGKVRQRVSIRGTDFEDWEDIQAGPCASGTCLYLADIGDNDADRESIVVYRIPEPAAEASRSAAPTARRGRYPDGAQDAEALVVSGTGEIYIITKGRTDPVRLYRFPARESSGVETLELVKELLPEPGADRDRITSGTLSLDGRWVGIRSYADLYIYDAARFFGSGKADPQVIDLSPAEQENGESVVIADGGTVWVTSEAGGGKNSSPEWARLECTLGG